MSCHVRKECQASTYYYNQHLRHLESSHPIHFGSLTLSCSPPALDAFAIHMVVYTLNTPPVRIAFWPLKTRTCNGALRSIPIPRPRKPLVRTCPWVGSLLTFTRQFATLNHRLLQSLG